MDVCAKLKGMLRERRIGHAGTLDPLAKGVLPVAVGIAVKDTEKVSQGTKEYSTCMLLGQSTDTDDITGKILNKFPGSLPDKEAILKELLAFQGDYEQLPPMYSARKIKGKKLYQYARNGENVQRKSKLVHIFEISLKKIELPRVYFTVSCSQGTYIRALIRDVGEKLHCGACMEELTRLKVGDFRIDDALKLDEIERLIKDNNLDSCLSLMTPTAISLGKFDGTHLGHQALLEELKNTAKKLSLKTLVIVFRFRNDGLFPDEYIRQKIMNLGIDYCMELKFTDEIKDTEAIDFLKDTLIKKYNMKAIVAGEDVSFGKDRKGNAAFLKEQSEELGFKLNIIKKICIEQDSGPVIISSSLVKQKLKEGKMEEVSRLMGENFSLRGEIVPGRHIGTEKLDLPTLNLLAPKNLLLPPYGVYAVRFTLSDPQIKEMLIKATGIANLGCAPTVSEFSQEYLDKGERSILLEIHAFLKLDDCYGLWAKVELLKFIRSERRFESLNKLRNQIMEHDIPEVLSFFSEENDV